MQTLVTMLLPQSNDKGLTIAGTGTKFPLRYKFARAAGVKYQGNLNGRFWPNEER